MSYQPFLQARPVWADGLETETNVTLGFYTCVNTAGKPLTLRVATSGFYRLFVNGKFTYYGPARCAEGFFRVDEITLDLPAGDAHIAIETVNYYLNSFAYIRQAGFIQIEIADGDKVLAATGDDSFAAYQLTERVRRIQRYSYQRPAAEGYIVAPDYADWRVGKACPNAVAVTATLTAEKTLVPRRISNSFFPDAFIAAREAYGTLCYEKPAHYMKDRSLTFPNDNTDLILGYKESELEWHLSDDAQHVKNATFEKDGAAYSGTTTVAADEFEILSLKGEKTGFITADITCHEAGSLYIFFDETLRNTGDVDPLSMTCCNIVRLDMQAGQYDAFQLMEPFGFRYVKIFATAGKFTVKNFCVRELIYTEPITATYKGSDPKLAAVFEAAKQTFLQNNSDLFMDCPTRERAGWLCDSFFTGRAEMEFTGKNVMEVNYLENFLLPESFPHLPHGMLPMCYPSDHYKGEYIPNWAMWFVLELEEHKNRGGDPAFVAKFKKRVYDLLAFFKQYENKDGLLDKLDSWVFVEWSKANDLVQDINFPSNMMYARMLEAAARLFDDPALAEKAAALKETIRKRSYDGTFFVDNEVYEGDTPVSTGERTETCQYYAFFTGVATPETYPELWEKLVTAFGPHRAEQGLYPEIYPANAFIGNYLRLILLEENGLYEQLLKEISGYFYYMAERTGTLWENTTDYASCNHSFASYAAHFIRVAEENCKK